MPSMRNSATESKLSSVFYVSFRNYEYLAQMLRIALSGLGKRIDAKIKAPPED